MMHKVRKLIPIATVNCALAAACFMPSHAMVYRVDFRAQTPPGGAPVSDFDVSVTYRADSILSPISEILDIDMTFGSTTFTLAEVGVLDLAGTGEYGVGGLVAGVSAVSFSEPDFRFRWVPRAGSSTAPAVLTYSTIPFGTSGIWSSTGTATVSVVPEPSAGVLMGAGLLAGCLFGSRRLRASA